MCLIIHREKGQTAITKEFFEDVWQKNDDGWGIMWKNPKDDFTRAKKGLDFAGFWNLYRTLESRDLEMVIHFRWKTDGAVNLEMCHPFLAYEDDLGGIWMMHNGVINHPYKVAWDKSDTWAFVDQIVRPMLTLAKSPYEMIRSDAFQNMLEDWCGTSNRLVFLDTFGVTLINETIWKKTTFGVLVSNTYAYNVGNPTKITYPTASNQQAWGNNWEDRWANTNSYSTVNTTGRSNIRSITAPKKEEPEVEKKETSPPSIKELFAGTPGGDEEEKKSHSPLPLSTGSKEAPWEPVEPLEEAEEGEAEPYDGYNVDLRNFLGNSTTSKGFYHDMELLTEKCQTHPEEIGVLIWQAPDLTEEFIEYLLMGHS